jgi:hypothetical protein
MAGLTVIEYVREDESNPYRAWFDSLHAQAAAKAAAAVVRLELGNVSGGEVDRRHRRVSH